MIISLLFKNRSAILFDELFAYDVKIYLNIAVETMVILFCVELFYYFFNLYGE